MGALLIAGCNSSADDVEDLIDDLVDTEVRGTVVDNRGNPVEGVEIKLFKLSENQNFVEGGDINSATAYIDREAVLASNNVAARAPTGADGKFSIKDELPDAFLAVATKTGCTAAFEGFDAETGYLNLNTLLKPQLADGVVAFDVPQMTIACGDMPVVGEDGTTDDANPFEPVVADVSCNETACAEAGGTCDGNACAITCSASSCGESGGSCVEGRCELAAVCNDATCGDLGGTCNGAECVLPACNADACSAAGGACNGDECITAAACDEAACAAANGTCSGDGTTCDIPACLAAEADCMGAGGSCSGDGIECLIPPCLAAEADCTAAGGACSQDGFSCELPACREDADCEAGQGGSFCENPGDLALASCVPPLPGELIPPTNPTGWIIRVTDLSGNMIADASEDNVEVDMGMVPSNKIIRVSVDYDEAAAGGGGGGIGSLAVGYLQVQTGSSETPDDPPRTDYVAVEVVDGQVRTSYGPFLDLVLSGGYQKIQFTPTDVAGMDDGSYVVEFADPGTKPGEPIIATLTWDASDGKPADLDLNIWNSAGEIVSVGSKQAQWGKLEVDGTAPGPESFRGTEGPVIIKVEFFAGKPRPIEAKLRVIRGDEDETFVFTVDHPKQIVEIGAFTIAQ